MEILPAYRKVSSEELAPLFDNLLNVGASTPYRVYDIVVPFLMNLHYLLHQSSPPFQITGVYFVGSMLTNLYVTPIEHHDIDMKILIKGTQEVASKYFSFFEKSPFLVIEENERNLLNLAFETFKPVYLDAYSFKGYTIMGHEGHLPLEISLLVAEDEIQLPSVMNLDSFFIPIALIGSPFGYGLGSSHLDSFQLYSTQGVCDTVIEEIKNKSLSCQHPQSVKKFGWPRFILALIDGFTSLDPALNQVFQECDMRELEKAIYVIHQFVNKKRAAHFPIFWTYFVYNAIFHSSRHEFLEKWVGQLDSLLKWPRQDLAWMSFLKVSLPKPLPKHETPFLLALLLPLFAQSISLKNHENKNWLQCMMGEWPKKLHILIPPLFLANPHQSCDRLTSFFQEAANPPFTYLKGELSVDESLIPFFASLSSFQEGSIGKEILFGWMLLCPSLFRSLQFFEAMPSSFSDNRYIPFKKGLLLEEIGNPQFSPFILKSSLFSFDLSLLNLEERDSLIQTFINQNEIFQSFLEEPIECFSSAHSPFDIIFTVLSLCEETDKSRVAAMLTRKALQKHQRDLWRMPSTGWEKCLQITKSLSIEHVRKGIAWKKILVGISESILQNQNKDLYSELLRPSDPALSELIEDLLRLSQWTWEDNAMWKEHFQTYLLLGGRNFPQEQLALHTLLDTQLDEEKLRYFTSLFHLFPSLLKKCIDRLINEKRGEEAIVLLGTQEESFELFCDVLLADASKLLDYIHTRLKYEKDEKLLISKLYVRLCTQHFLATELEENYLFQENDFFDFLKREDQSLQDSFQSALSFRLQDPAFMHHYGCRAHSIIIRFADYISFDNTRHYAALFVDQYEKTTTTTFSKKNEQAHFYFPYLNINELSFLAKKCGAFSLNNLFSDIYNFVADQDQEASFSLHLLSSKNLKLSEFSSNSLLQLLQGISKLREPPSEASILSNIRDCICISSLKIKKKKMHLKDVSVLSQLVESIENYPVNAFIQQLLLAEVSEKLIALLTQEKEADSLTAASRLLRRVHSNRILSSQKLDLSCDVKALAHFLMSAVEIPFFLSIGFEIFYLLINKMQQSSSSVPVEVLPLLVRSVDIASKSMEINAVSLDMNHFVSILCSMRSPYMESPVPENLVFEVLTSLLSVTDQAMVQKIISDLLKNLSRNNVLEGRFIHDLAKKMALVYDISLARAYTSIFMTDFFTESISQNVFVKMMIEPDKIKAWNEEEAEIFLIVFSTVIDRQLAAKAHEHLRGDIRLTPILQVYLKLLEKSSNMHVCPNLLIDIINFPHSYFSQGNFLSSLLRTIEKLVELKKTRSYLPHDIQNGEVDNFIRACMATFQFFSQEKREEILSIILEPRER